MEIVKLAIISLSCLFTLYFFSQDYKKGLSVAVFLLILMPRELFVEIGGGLPTLTGFRAVILVLTFYSLYVGKFKIGQQKIPIMNFLFMVLLAKICSLMFAFDFAQSLNGVLIFALERLLFFVILVKTIDDRETLNKVINSMVYAVFVIAIIGLVEKYTQFNPIDYISLPDHPRFDPQKVHEVYSTLPHPILLGTVLAMGWPICLYILDKQIHQLKKYILGLFLFIIMVDIYFSQSRGPWLAFMVGFIMLLLLNYPRIKMKAIVLVYMTIIALFLRPGVYETITNLSAATFDDQRIEGSSFFYRLELFRIAFQEIIKYPERVLFGYGDGAAQAMDIQAIVNYGSGREVNFWSWDSEYALIMLQGGFIGLFLNLLLFLSVLFFLIKGNKYVEEQDRSLMIALISSNTVLVVMMTNVAIFAPQLWFLFWTNTAIGIISSQKKELTTS